MKRGLLGLTLFFVGTSLLTTLVFPPLRAVDERAHVAHTYAVTSGDLPSVTDAQTGGPYTYRTDRTLYTAHHPPLFPLLIGPVIRSGNLLADADLAVRAARLVSVGLGALAMVFTAGLLHELVPRRPSVALAGAAFVAATPLLAHISGLIYNDAAALAAMTAASWAGLRILRLGPSRHRVIALSASVAIAGLVRISVVPVALAAVAVALAGAWRHERSLGSVIRTGTPPAAALTVFAGWFYVRNLLDYGDVSGGDELYDILDRRPRPLSDLVDPAFVRARVSGMWTSREWERGKYGIGPLDTLVEIGFALVVVVGLALLIRALVARRIDGATLSFGVVSLGIAAAGFAVHVTSGGTPHSRYLFGVLWIVGLAAAVAMGRLPRIASTIVLAATLVASALVTVIGLDEVLRNRDLPIGPWGDLANYLADTGIVMQAAIALAGLGTLAGGVLVTESYATLRGRERSSPPPNTPKHNRHDPGALQR